MIENPKNPILSLDVQKMQTWVAPAKTMYQGDQGYVQPFRLTNSWENYDVKADNLCFSATKPDGGIIEIENEPDRFVEKGGVWFFKLPDQITQAIGAVNCFFYVKDHDQDIVASTTKFTYRVEAKFTDAENHNSYISSIKKLEDIFYEYIQTAKTMVNSLDFELNKELSKIQEDWQVQKDELSDDVNTYRDNLYERLDGVNEKINDIEFTTVPEVNTQLKDARKKLNDLLEKLKDVNFGDYAQKEDLKPFIKTVQGIKPDENGNVTLDLSQGLNASEYAKKDELKNFVKSVHGVKPDENGNIELDTNNVPDLSDLLNIKIKRMLQDGSITEVTPSPKKMENGKYQIDLSEDMVAEKVQELATSVETNEKQVNTNKSDIATLNQNLSKIEEKIKPGNNNNGTSNELNDSKLAEFEKKLNNVAQTWFGSQSEYENLTEKSENIIYFILEEGKE